MLSHLVENFFDTNSVRIHLNFCVSIPHKYKKKKNKLKYRKLFYIKVYILFDILPDELLRKILVP